MSEFRLPEEIFGLGFVSTPILGDGSEYGQLFHPAQETMHSHLVSCARRPASDGGWRIARRAAQVPITAAIALVMAVGHATEPQQSVSIISA